jgi:tetrahydromethanopterin S-methyltransferase subunit G
MNEKVKRRLENIYSKVEKIKSETDYINEDLIPEVGDDSMDLITIEDSLENIERWARETREYVRNTYDEFEESED